MHFSTFSGMKAKTGSGRRDFLRNTAAASAGLALGGGALLSCTAGGQAVKNALPMWRGFNLLDFFLPDPQRAYRSTTEEELKWMADWGFDFIRIPMSYPSYLEFDRSRDITPEEVYQVSEEALEKVDQLVHMVNKYGMHASINLHRAPGYCINAGFHEPYNLWKDAGAQEAFLWHWSMWAKRYKEKDRRDISFDLLNEPAWIEDMNDQHSPKVLIPGDTYANLVIRTAEAIWAENPDHLVIADGNQVGTKVIDGITHLPIGQSCRGYYPHMISHYKAPWAMKDIENLPELKYPGEVDGQYLGREMLEEFYAPWIELVKSGVGVHCGECGAYNKTPHRIFLDWFGDVVDILTSNGIGFALWNFNGDFGVLNSGRKDVDYEDWYGQKLDRKLLDLIRA